MKTVSIIGGGQTGRAFGKLLSRAGFELRSVVCRSLPHAKEAVAFIGAGTPTLSPEKADLILLAVPDDQIEAVSSQLEGISGSIVIHLCGALSVDVLESAKRAGARVGALHPLRSFADPEAAVDSFGGTYCAVEGDPSEELKGLVESIGGIPLRLDSTGKILYHAGAVFASNYLVTLLDASRKLLEKAGIPKAESLGPALSLAQGTLRNIERIGIPEALSGPVERGDVGTLQKHWEEIQSRMPELTVGYSELARKTVEVALEKGSVSGARAKEMQDLFRAGGAE
ncbi:MAG: DUF2520 domain-containing protein [Planctomycetota bacterium]|nr:DUF2520 domain-containing protein [Planctomycetota bacterium]